MALSATPLAFALGTVAVPGTSVAPTLAVPENCHTILVTNPDAAAIGLVGIGTAPVALVAGVNAQRIPPGTTLTLGLGTLSMRGFMNAATLVGSGLVFDADVAVGLEVTYLCTLGQAV